MQPYTFSPWIWRDPGIIGGSVGRVDRATDDQYVDDAEADEVASEGIAGFHVEAVDGHIGSIDEASYEVGGAYLVVDTGPWIFGRKVLLPAGTCSGSTATSARPTWIGPSSRSRTHPSTTRTPSVRRGTASRLAPTTPIVTATPRRRLATSDLVRALGRPCGKPTRNASS
jgi:hypothetical protein